MLVLLGSATRGEILTEGDLNPAYISAFAALAGAAIAGVDVEVAIRSLMLLIVLCCDPAAIALTVAASRRN